MQIEDIPTMELSDSGNLDASALVRDFVNAQTRTTRLNALEAEVRTLRETVMNAHHAMTMLPAMASHLDAETSIEYHRGVEAGLIHAQSILRSVLKEAVVNEANRRHDDVTAFYSPRREGFDV